MKAKVGDKVWFFVNHENTIKEAVVSSLEWDGVRVEWTEDGHPCDAFLFLDDIFPTREALCEYYRKIFE